MPEKYRIYESDYNLEYYIDFNIEDNMFWGIRQWCNDNIEYNWQVVMNGNDKCTIHFTFHNEISFMAFKLRWS